MILSNCAKCGCKKSKFIKKKQEKNGSLSSLGIKTLLARNKFIPEV